MKRCFVMGVILLALLVGTAWGAATTTPGRPARVVIVPAPPVPPVIGGSSTARDFAHPAPIKASASTLASQVRGIGNGDVVDQHRLGERVLALVGERHQHPAAAARAPDLP